VIRKLWRALLSALAFVVVAVSLPADAGRLVVGSRGAGGTAPYTWYSALDLNTVPWYTASGAWGSQYTITAPTAPTAPTAVTVTTCAGLVSAMEAGGRTITVENGTTIDCSSGSNAIGPTVTDVDVIIQPGAVLKNILLGESFGSNQITINRVRFRGTTVGQHSGGQLHNLDIVGTGNVNSLANDIILDGIDITGGNSTDVTATNAVNLQIWGSRLAVVYCRVAAGGEFYIGGLGDSVFAGNSILTALTNPETVEDESWAIRVTARATGAHILYQNDIRAATPGRTNVFHRYRIHPGPEGAGHFWAADNTLVDRVEARIFWVNADADSSAHGWLESFITDGNRIYAGGTAMSYYSESALYVLHQNNVIRATFAVSDTSLVVCATINCSDETPPGLSPTVVKTGNTYPTNTADPAWGAQGDPSGLNWNI
jgi:hypothetical protein